LDDIITSKEVGEKEIAPLEGPEVDKIKAEHATHTWKSNYFFKREKSLAELVEEVLEKKEISGITIIAIRNLIDSRQIDGDWVKTFPLWRQWNRY
jgi:hypothetical protein